MSPIKMAVMEPYRCKFWIASSYQPFQDSYKIRGFILSLYTEWIEARVLKVDMVVALDLVKIC